MHLPNKLIKREENSKAVASEYREGSQLIKKPKASTRGAMKAYVQASHADKASGWMKAKPDEENDDMMPWHASARDTGEAADQAAEEEYDEEEDEAADQGTDFQAQEKRLAVYSTLSKNIRTTRTSLEQALQKALEESKCKNAEAIPIMSDEIEVRTRLDHFLHVRILLSEVLLAEHAKLPLALQDGAESSEPIDSSKPLETATRDAPDNATPEKEKNLDGANAETVSPAGATP